MTRSSDVTPATVLIAGAQGVLRAGLRAMFVRYPYLQVVGEAAGGNEALHLARQLVPDLVLLDINIRELDGIAITEALGRALPATRVLILTAARDVEPLRRALRAGASGYVVLTANESELMNAIEAVLRGDLYLDPSVTRVLLLEDVPAEPSSQARDSSLAPLTAREIDVIRLVCDGYTNAQMARSLGLSVRTIESHRANLAHKLGTHGRADMVRRANEYGLRQTQPGPQPESTSQIIN